MIQRILLGVLIIGFLIAEPDGLAAFRSASTVSPVACVPVPRRRAKFNVQPGVSVMTFGLRGKSRARLGARARRSVSRTAPSLADEQFFPLQSYRVGPYAAGGSGFFGGFIDYMNLINIRDGGVNGVKLTWAEGETQYEVERGVEVYERLKSHPAVAAWNPLSVGIAYAMIDRITQDKTPLITVNHGRTELDRRARVSLRVSAAAQSLQRDVGHRELHLEPEHGGLDNLKGKKIVVLYHGSPYGKETIPIYELLAKKYGFDVQQIEVPHPGVEQQSQWLTIRRAKPDYVVLRGWGVMNPVALKTAAKVGFPADNIVGNVWSNSEEDVMPAGEAAIGYTAITTQASGESIRSSRRSRRPSTAPARATSTTSRASARSTTTSASSTASSMSRPFASRRRSLAIAR